jgi:hypothetical protein
MVDNSAADSTDTTSALRSNIVASTGIDLTPSGSLATTLGKETYYRSADGTIMPTSKDQPPPDLRYFTPSAK